jgi:glycosyltransferase involved in cell wall biosynthesis
MSRTVNQFNDRRTFQFGGREIVVDGTVEAFAAEVVIGVALHNQSLALPDCLTSISAQQNVPLRFAVLLLDDESEDDWRSGLERLSPQVDLACVRLRCGTAASARNSLLDLADLIFPDARWVARLDADDRFASPDSMGAMLRLAMSSEARFVIGGNHLRQRGNLLERSNPATPDLLRAEYVISRLARMAQGDAAAELPSCNLLLATHTGWRYPELTSAEDHWLVAELLLRHADKGAVLTEPFYAEYTLDGAMTSQNRQQSRHLSARQYLYQNARAWLGEAQVLGSGREGVVTLSDGRVCKRFYPGKPPDDRIPWLQNTLRNTMPHLPEPVWERDDGQWCALYPWFESQPADRLTLTELRDFFCFCLERNLVTPNIKHANFRRSPSGLTFIDIGGDVLPMNVDYFRDACARGFALAELGWTDHVLYTRSQELRREDFLLSLPGFAEFYSSILHEHARRQWAPGLIPKLPAIAKIESQVTLLIKACAMDAVYLTVQVRHLVGQLERHRRFTERVLAIDPFRGPYLRQHCSGNWDRLIEEATALVKAGWLDRIIIAPDDAVTTSAINERWFAVSCQKTHCIRGVPVTPQLWAFEQVRTRYILQCDVDALIGRRDLSHDYLADMLAAAEPSDVLGVSFNIAHPADAGFRPYAAPPGEFMPEVACGLLDLERVLACHPLPNSLTDGRLTLTWYRSLQRYQREHGLRTPRGGDPRTFCVHPPNTWKNDEAALDRVRDLVAQACVPSLQFENWALAGTPGDWQYAPRHESIVFLIRGRNTPVEKIERCLASLAIQEDQNFGMVLFDDASENGTTTILPHLLKPFVGRYTLVCRSRHHGYIPNMLTAARDIITSPETLIVILDMDDALLHCSVVASLQKEMADGADVILASMFRPEKPLKLYHPDFVEPRSKWGGEVWIHLRSFQKRLLDALPDEHFKLDGNWIPHCEDSATMIPLVELAVKPVYLPIYLYFHQRTTQKTPALRAVKEELVRKICEKPSVSHAQVNDGNNHNHET